MKGKIAVVNLDHSKISSWPMFCRNCRSNVVILPFFPQKFLLFLIIFFPFFFFSEGGLLKMQCMYIPMYHLWIPLINSPDFFYFYFIHRCHLLPPPVVTKKKKKKGNACLRKTITIYTHRAYCNIIHSQHT